LRQLASRYIREGVGQDNIRFWKSRSENPNNPLRSGQETFFFRALHESVPYASVISVTLYPNGGLYSLRMNVPILPPRSMGPVISRDEAVARSAMYAMQYTSAEQIEVLEPTELLIRQKAFSRSLGVTPFPLDEASEEQKVQGELMYFTRYRQLDPDPVQTTEDIEVWIDAKTGDMWYVRRPLKTLDIATPPKTIEVPRPKAVTILAGAARKTLKGVRFQPIDGKAPDGSMITLEAGGKMFKAIYQPEKGEIFSSGLRVSFRLGSGDKKWLDQALASPPRGEGPKLR
jgi:hypothetical protein